MIAVTKKELGQYRSLCDEIIELETAIKENTEHSTVRGSDATFPYLSHPMQVSGVQSTTDNQNTLIKVRKLKLKKQEIENFIENIEDSLTRRIFRLRFIDGKNWVKVADDVGGNNTADCVKKICYRYIDKVNKKIS